MKCVRLAVAVALLIVILPSLGGDATNLRLSPPRAGAQTQVTYDFGADVSPSVRALVQDTVASALPFFAETFQYALGDPFTVHVYSTRDELLEVYARERQITREEAQRALSPAAASATENPCAIWIRLAGTCFTHAVSPDNLACNIKRVIYHELFHLWQHQLGVRTWYVEQGLRGAYAQSWWLVEGTADFAAYLGIQRLGMASAQDVLLYLKREVMRYGAIDSLSELVSRRGRGYETAALAFFRLAGDQPARITAFFRSPSFRQDWRGAFESTFGRSVQAFELEFKADLEAIVAEGRRLTMRVIGDGQVVPRARVGPARVGMSPESLIADLGPPDRQGTASSGSRWLQWSLQEPAYREATGQVARLLVWMSADGARIAQAIAYSGAFRTPGGNTVASSLAALLQEFPPRTVQPAGSDSEWAFGDGIYFLYRVPSRTVLAIGVR